MKAMPLLAILALCGCAGSRQQADQPRLTPPYCGGLACLPLMLSHASLYAGGAFPDAPPDVMRDALAWIAKNKEK